MSTNSVATSHENRLARETSPYLLQHKHNPVDWWPWGTEALAEAKRTNKPILLSVGYAACHWCHVMAHESFEDTATAKVMNDLFVNIKVDREERPDIDQIYMSALHHLGEHGGWPLTMFLTPGGEPFWGGTYFPKTARYGKPAFVDLLREVERVFRQEPQSVEQNRSALMERLAASARPEGRVVIAPSDLDRAADQLVRMIDPVNGGMRGAPKFPQPIMLECLWRAAERTNNARYCAAVELTLARICEGGIYDHLGGGFSRYSVDERWLVPHFEKMLYDNALLLPVYLHGWLVTGKERFREIVEETVTYMLRELALPEGGFASAQDADTDGVEGLTFTWTPDEGVPQEFLEPFEHGRSIIRGELPRELKAELLERRERRPKPLRADKAIAAWNGLALAALAEAGARLQNDEWLDAARRLGDFLLGPLSTPEGRLFRTYRNGVAKNTGFLDDYADVAHGLYELHVATGEAHWLDASRRLAMLAVELFGDDERGGFFLTPSDGEELVARKKDFDDHPTPSGNSMLAYVLLRLARIYGDAELERRAVDVFRLVVNGLRRAPSAFGWSLCALDLHFSPPRELAVFAQPDDEIARAALRPWQPNAVVAFGPADGVPLLEGKLRVDGKPTVYVCENFACRTPVTDPALL